MPLTDDSFAAFWALYPRRVAKKAAERAWSRLSPDAALVEQIMAGLRAQLPMFRRKIAEGNGGYVPHPSTWLNQRRFEDEVVTNRNQLPRVIECANCGDTGVVFAMGSIESQGSVTLMNLTRCVCARGQLPGLMTGTYSLDDGRPIHAEDAL